MAIIQQIIFEDNLLKKLKATNIIINALDNKIKEKTNAAMFQKYIHNLFTNAKFMRKLEYISTFRTNTELMVEYLGMDYLSSSDYNYDEEYEAEVIQIEKKLAVFLGSVLKEQSKGVDIEL